MKKDNTSCGIVMNNLPIDSTPVSSHIFKDAQIHDSEDTFISITSTLEQSSVKQENTKVIIISKTSDRQEKLQAINKRMKQWVKK